MDKNTLIKLVNKRYSSYRIAQELNTNQSVIYRKLIKFGLKTKQMANIQLERFCLTCKKKLKGKQMLFCSRKCNNHNIGRFKKVYDQSKNRGKERRKKLVELKGGKCEKCGYDKNLAVLCFHHRNPKEKSFTLNRCTQSWNKLIEELNKCDLLCANCHTELHHPNF